MGVSNLINSLRSNIMGAGSSAGPSSLPPKRTPIELSQDQGPLAKLNKDPLGFSTLSYPKDLVNKSEIGHYILFYINVQNKTKYKMNPYDTEAGTKVGETVQYFDEQQIAAGTFQAAGTKFVSYGDTEASYRKGLIQKGAKGNVLDSDGKTLRKGRKAKSGIASVLPTTTRITDSIAIYLPPNVTDTTGASYSNEAEMGIVGMAAATGGDFVLTNLPDDENLALSFAFLIVALPSKFFTANSMSSFE